MYKVFVYGTLKAGQDNHSLMKLSGAHFLGTSETSEKYTMVSLGNFPGVLEGGKDSIKGEVYLLERIDILDDLEGYPDFYQKKIIETSFGKAVMYFLSNYNSYKHYPHIPGGNWE